MLRVLTGTAQIPSSDPQCHLSKHLMQLLWGTFLYPLESTVQGLGNSECDLERADSLHFTTSFGQEMPAFCDEIPVILVRLR